MVGAVAAGVVAVAAAAAPVVLAAAGLAFLFLDPKMVLNLPIRLSRALGAEFVAKRVSYDLDNT